MKNNNKVFQCADCGGAVVVTNDHDLTWKTRHKGKLVDVKVPKTIELPTCIDCGEVYLDDDDADEVEQAVQQVLLYKK